MANYKLEDVKGTGPVLAEKTGLSEARVLRFANMVDRYRVSGVGSDMPNRSKSHGPTRCPNSPRGTRPASPRRCRPSNQEKKLTRQAPTESEVAKWIEQAKGLPRMLEY